LHLILAALLAAAPLESPHPAVPPAGHAPAATAPREQARHDAAADSAAHEPAPDTPPADSTAGPESRVSTSPSDSSSALPSGRPRIVRRFPPIEVAAGRLHDMRSSATVHVVTSSDLVDLPVGSLAQALALQPGVVATGEDLHVRGGRAGETQWTLSGVTLNEPLRGRAPELPLLALARVELLAGGLDAEYTGALAGVVDVRTVDPTPGPTGAVRWLSTGRRGTSYDWLGVRGAAPIGFAGLGIAAAGEARLDDQSLPGRSYRGRDRVLGRSFGWRSDNHLLGWAKLAPVASPRSVSLEVTGSRTVQAPWDPMFSWDDSVRIHVLRVDCEFCPPELDSLTRYYRASDHQPMTETRRWTTLLQATRLAPRATWRAALAWQHGSELTSPGLARDPRALLPGEKLRFGQDLDPERDAFRAYQGDWAYYRRTRDDRLQASVSGTLQPSPKVRFGFGAGATWDDVEFFELDAVEPTRDIIDSLRAFHTRAPGAWGYVQHRGEREGLVWNTGVRLEMFDAGDATARAGVGPTGVLPDVRGGGARWTWSPRLGVAFPLSVRDAVSASYARIHQAPGREYLADDRLLVHSRRPLGNPTLAPGELVSAQVGLQHVFDARWAAQLALFQRDLYGQLGIVNDPYFGGTFRPRYANSGYGHATGFELALLGAARRAPGEARHGPASWAQRIGAAEMALRYTFMTSFGTMSDPDGWAYGFPFGFRPLPVGEHPLDWDRGHTFTFDAVWREPRAWTLSLVSQVASGARWTPTVTYDGTAAGPLAAPDLAAVNSRQLPWTERTDVVLRLQPPVLRGARLLVEVRNLFDSRGDMLVSLPGFPNPTVNTLRDDYAGYRTDTGRGGGAWWDPKANGGAGGWVPVNDPRLARPARSLRLGVEAGL